MARVEIIPLLLPESIVSDLQRLVAGIRGIVFKPGGRIVFQGAVEQLEV